MKPQSVLLTLRSDWHIGSGEEGGAYADALVLKQGNGLPYLPGKSLKGLFREAFEQANENNWFSASMADGENIIPLLFGYEGEHGTTQGILQFTSAMLSAHEQHYFDEHKTAIKHLYRVIQATAIEEKTGVALGTSLRAMEVSVPMTLTAQVSINNLHSNYEQAAPWPIQQWLAQCGTLILALGAKRHRGMGQVLVTVNPQGVSA